MRVTESMRLDALSVSQKQAASQLYSASQRASSGTQVAAPSDGPAAYSKVTVYDATITRLTNRATQISQAADRLDIADGALANAADILAHARELAVQMANADVDPAARARVASEVSQLTDELVGLANTKNGSDYAFAGTATATPPFSATGAFSGNDDAIQIETSDGVLARTNASGAKAFTAAGGRDVFQDMASFQQALATNNVAGIQASIDSMEAAHVQIISARSEVGVASARLRAAGTMTTSMLTSIQTSRSHAADADPVEAYTALSQAKSTYERSMQVTAQILSLATFRS
jgi:flagellar hook-associated protein 3 FlgL